MSILSSVPLYVSGGFADADYRQRPSLSETWERGQHEAIEILDCDAGTSNNFIRNLVGTVWYNRNRSSGVSRYVPKQYTYRKGTYGSTNPGNYSSITTGTYDNQTRGYGRPWYAYRVEAVNAEGVPIQWQADTSEVKAGDIRWIGTAPSSLTVSQLNNTVPTPDGREVYNVHYKPMRYMVRTDAEIDALTADVNYTELGRYVIRDYRFASRNLTLPPNFLYWASDLNPTTGALIPGYVPIPEGPTKLFPTINMLYTLVDIPWVPQSAIMSAIGKVNAAETTHSANLNGYWDYQGSIDATNWPLRKLAGFPAGTVLFDGVHDLIEETNAAGQYVCSVTYSLIYRPTGWNYFFNYKTNQFAQAVTKESINQPQANWKYLYSETSLNELFRLPIA